MGYCTEIELGGEWALLVPIRVYYTFQEGYAGSRIDPPEAAMLEDVKAERLDGLPWHSGCDRAFETARAAIEEAILEEIADRAFYGPDD